MLLVLSAVVQEDGLVTRMKSFLPMWTMRTAVAGEEERKISMANQKPFLLCIAFIISGGGPLSVLQLVVLVVMMRSNGFKTSRSILMLIL